MPDYLEKRFITIESRIKKLEMHEDALVQRIVDKTEDILELQSCVGILQSKVNALTTQHIKLCNALGQRDNPGWEHNCGILGDNL